MIRAPIIRAGVLLIIAAIAACAIAASLAKRPLGRSPIEAGPAVWPTNAAFGGIAAGDRAPRDPRADNWCDVRPEPPPRPRGRYGYRPGEATRDRGIA